MIRHVIIPVPRTHLCDR